MSEPHDAVGHAQFVAGRAEQPVVRPVVLAALFGRDVARGTAVQRGDHVGRGAAVRHRAPGRGTGNAGPPVRIPRAQALSDAGRVA